MASLEFHPGADPELTRLERDPASAKVVRALEEHVFRRLAADPGDPVIRRRRFTNGLWAVTITVTGDDFTVLWDGEDLPETVVVRFVGRMPMR